MASTILVFALLSVTCRENNHQADSHRGKWVVASVEESTFKNTSIPTVGQKGDEVEFLDNKIIYKSKNGIRQEIAYKINKRTVPWEIDMTVEDNDPPRKRVLFGIIDVNSQQIRMCHSTLNDNERPKEFSIKEGFAVLFILNRKPKK